MLPFRHRLTLEQRINEYAKIKQKCVAYIPVIFERHKDTDPSIDREKFLVPLDLTASQLQFILRKRLHMTKDHALFMFVGNKLLGGTTSVHHIYTKTPTEDGFLYVTYSLENAFGAHTNAAMM